ncbi:TetR/AcrR family transcriptional regulator [Phreatobacter stygius]|uniref:TetR/AcrR family transcriptional regulator n=1 Tax=Phreatobacter stygius TaxID=1940610 RepID=A0A4D7AWV4_9HYPH|nr:TetR/AcrR family transcriptional regulator [Phreatobacter stygius]QCI63328.1 TetR/AcrR family transcriptional regulator [Phreatobacter stygius]
MTAGKASPRPARRGGRQSYHHGMLRDALIRAAVEILSERGAEGFTLREAARRAGVSAGAPAHHFGSAAGLLTEVVIAGFEDLTQALRAAAGTAASPAARLRAQGMSYVRFALAHPGRFQLMFRHDLLLAGDERLGHAGKAAKAELEATIRAYITDRDGPGADERSVRAALLGAWSAVHGFAHLALDGKFTAMAQPRSISGFVSDELPDVLLAFWPDREDEATGR